MKQFKSNVRKTEPNKFGVTNNLSESFHSAFKRVSDGKRLVRTEHVLLSLYIHQARCIQEFDRTVAGTGVFCLKPEFEHSVITSGLPLAPLDFKVLLKDAKEKTAAFDPKTIESRDDNWTERQLATYVINVNKISFSVENNCFVVGHPLFENQPQVVLLSEDGVFTCVCRQKSKVGCFHIVAAKLKSGHNYKISNNQQLSRLSLIQRTYTRKEKEAKRFHGLLIWTRTRILSKLRALVKKLYL